MKKETAKKTVQLWAEIQRLVKEKDKVTESSRIALVAIIETDYDESQEYCVLMSDIEGQKIRQYVIEMFEEEIREKEQELEKI